MGKESKYLAGKLMQFASRMEDELDELYKDVYAELCGNRTRHVEFDERVMEELSKLQWALGICRSNCRDLYHDGEPSTLEKLLNQQ